MWKSQDNWLRRVSIGGPSPGEKTKINWIGFPQSLITLIHDILRHLASSVLGCKCHVPVNKPKTGCGRWQCLRLTGEPPRPGWCLGPSHTCLAPLMGVRRKGPSSHAYIPSNHFFRWTSHHGGSSLFLSLFPILLSKPLKLFWKEKKSWLLSIRGWLLFLLFHMH